MFLCLKTKKVLMSKNKKSSYVKNKELKKQISINN